MPRELLEQGLRHLQDELVTLGSMVENAITESVVLLRRRDVAGSRRLIAHDRVINERRFSIESEALALIATQQPIARDLRTIAAVLEIVTELERIGDYAKGVARINLLMGEGVLFKPLPDVAQMAELVREMLHQALKAFVRRDAESARAITEQDDAVDALYNKVYRDLMACIITSPSCLDQSSYVLWVAHNLERAADRVTNICERVIFTVTGHMVELDAEDSEGMAAIPA